MLDTSAISTDGALLGTLLAALLALLAWALSRASAARERELDYLKDMATVRTKVDGLETALDRHEEREEKRDEVLSGIASDIAALRATLDGHLERDAYCAAANNGSLPHGRIAGNRQ